MENILNKDIFNERDLEKLSPDYKPLDVVLRMQTRRTIVSKHSLSNFYSQIYYSIFTLLLSNNF